ncbi:MAG: hypothetical protein O4M80_05175, partial [Buchnera aphidicola]|nr:hypothetical protein [Buchnera aphidicola]
YKKYFTDHFYLEIHRTRRSNEEEYINLAINLSIDQSLPLVATNDVCFLYQEDFNIHKIRIAIHEGCILQDSLIINHYSDQQFLKN